MVKELSMQPRLTRNPNDKMIAGVCSGLGEYFSIDPVIVRLIFVIITLSSGLGLPIYLVLWWITPSQPAQVGQPYQPNAQQFGQEVGQIGQQVAQEAREFVMAQQRSAQGTPRVDAPFAPPPADYRFDPVTGQPLGPTDPSTGQTVNLNMGQQQLQPYAQVPPTTPRKRNWNVLGLVLLGVGAIILLGELGINTSLIFPLILIVAGILLLRRKR
jgi:phage shock protein C